jgi:hypothetical protein
MSLGTRSCAVVAAKRFLNLVQCGGTLCPRLPIPEHDKSQTTNAAESLGISFCGLAEYLHRESSREKDGRTSPRKKT